MPPAALYTTLLILMTQATHSRQRDYQHVPRVSVTQEEMTFNTFPLPGSENHKHLNLIKDPESINIYAGGPKGLYLFNPDTSELNKVSISEFATCKDSTSDCPSSISLLTEGNKENPLFICGMNQCCKMVANHTAVDCFKMEIPVDINEPSLYSRDMVYFTISEKSNNPGPLGLYRLNQRIKLWPQPREKAQKYIRIFENKDSRKLYSFYIEKNDVQDPEQPFWIPRVSQYCMDDKGGDKNYLQFRWTSMLTARLFCGDKSKGSTYSELLDVAVVEEKEKTVVYALFKNTYDITAVCVYSMSRITQIFTHSQFKEAGEAGAQFSRECNASRTKAFLAFMDKRPEMKEWIEPERGPLLVSHHQYTHLLVDRVTGTRDAQHNVLLLSLGNGKIHKVLEEDGETFIIAEYHPFRDKTQILSMLLDRTSKKLYVGSSKELVQIDLQNCSLYTNECESCVMSRDPYCAWREFSCSPTEHAGHEIQDVKKGNGSVCDEDKPQSDMVRKFQDMILPEHSRYYLKCSMLSQHASYSWKHNGKSTECVSTQKDCLLLIENTSQEDEGLYQCMALENGRERTITTYSLVGSASRLRVAPVAFLLLLIHLTR